MKNTVTTLRKQKEEGSKISMLTCYDYTTACLVEQAGVNAVLIGDSLGMTMLGYDDTLPVTMEDMIHHTRAVSRGLKDTFLVADMPFLSYQTSTYDAVVNAGRLVKEGHAQAVKLEGGATVCEQIRAIVKADIPVCAHIGLTPQSINAFGGFKVQGKDAARARQVVEDALAVQEAGAFMVVLECVPAALASYITEILDIPTIGIGAGAGCDGQVLVYQDMLGMFSGMKPKFVKHFAEIGETMRSAFAAYDEEVKNGTYPAEEHTFKISEEVMDEVRKGMDQAC
ncbi:MAG: 3-methyl-2-oxobutanoate hydroxymethyltransferase [Lachnospiraceae bacterium]|jgi:3-methyl-2-oxobutanoate hydroxymethyltransferase|nr:3-methyl-2-oxobutanoate hydroxymethyltransferase [Lachnospiraceae bacterium]SFT32018.1 3-methyl-2-oxobutanoate hydroxymethyltransferase [Lachnospiraceae bacterium XBD2001]MBQ1721584.1 3-methyl-2-oxobutanoate hydroxymethyltransferase [Lachnospiraceae bacterium]MBQ2317777.1 3-methyl-2-oxobutanoate hydroxymethyltransferase [Lachnospiraceae bacterium]MBQ2577878.1 3-methyl-2-oxobutanoate hydroxymethyltransferase [Lachnospiraceae bacterium]